MLSRHWRLWLSFPSLALPPEEQLGIDLCVPLDSRTHASGCALRSTWLWSRRLTEPPRPANVGERSNHKISASKGWRGDWKAGRRPPSTASPPQTRPPWLPSPKELSCVSRMTEDTPPRSLFPHIKIGRAHAGTRPTRGTSLQCDVAMLTQQPGSGSPNPDYPNRVLREPGCYRPSRSPGWS